MTRVLVTGANGFVGGAVVRHLLTLDGVDVVATCRTAGPSLADLARANPRLTLAPGIDLADATAVGMLPGNVTHVIHAAAIARFEGVSREELDRANVTATGHLLRWAGSLQPPLKRFLYVSTYGVHDRPASGRALTPITEQSPFAAVSEYGRSKHRGEAVVRRGGVPHVVARLSWIYGPGMHDYSHIRVLAGMCQKGSPVTRLDFPGRVSVAHVDDVARALVRLVTKDTLAHDAYLIAHAEPLSFGQMFQTFRTLATGAPAAMMPLGPLAAIAARLTPLMPMKVRSLFEDYYVASPARLEAEGAAPTIAWRDGFRQSVTEGRWFAGRNILITGAASGLGRSLALEAHRRGYTTWLVDVSPSVAEVAASIGGQSLVADLSDASSYERIAAWAPDIDVLVNNAGIAIKAPFAEMAPAAIDRLIRINVSAPVQLSRLYLPRFQARGRGVIVNVSSSASYFPTPGLGAYGASKAFLSAFSEALAVEAGSKGGVQIIAACPSGMKTAFQQSSGVRNEKESLLLDPDDVARRMLNDVEAGRAGVTDYGITSLVFRTFRLLLPRGAYRALIGRLMGKYR